MLIKLFTATSFNSDNVEDDGALGIYTSEVDAGKAAYDFCLSMFDNSDGEFTPELTKLKSTYDTDGYDAFYDAFREIRDEQDWDCGAQVAEFDVNIPKSMLQGSAQPILDADDIIAMGWVGANGRDWTGEDVVEAHNECCTIGLEIAYDGDSMWHFTDRAEASDILEEQKRQDEKRTSD